MSRLEANPALLRMGYAATDRVVILHADDLGMCHAADVAFEGMIEFGWVHCGSVMVPCPWFLELAAITAKYPQADVGVHLTLNSEWSCYRWPPLSTRNPASGLLDAEGYLPRTVEEVHEQLVPESAIAEMRAQIERALDTGIDLTHLDTHMGAVVQKDLLPAYVSLALEFNIPVMTARFSPEELEAQGFQPGLATEIEELYDRLEELGIPLVDHLASLPLDHSGDLISQYKHAFDGLKPGLTHFVVHPCAPGFDMEAISESAVDRFADYRAMVSEELKVYVEERGIGVIGYRQLRELMRRADS